MLTSRRRLSRQVQGECGQCGGKPEAWPETRTPPETLIKAKGGRLQEGGGQDLCYGWRASFKRFPPFLESPGTFANVSSGPCGALEGGRHAFVRPLLLLSGVRDHCDESRLTVGPVRCPYQFISDSMMFLCSV